MTSTEASLEEVFESLLTEAVRLGIVDVQFAPNAQTSGLIGSTKQFVKFGVQVSADQFKRAAALLAPKNGYVYTPGARWRFMNTDGCVIFRMMPALDEAPVGMGAMATLNESSKHMGGERG